MRSSFVVLLSMGLVYATGPVHATEPSAAPAEPAADAGASSSGAVDPRVRALQVKYAEAQEQLEHYEEDHDAESLERGHQLLREWLLEHRTLYGDTPAAIEVRRPVFEELRTAEAELARLERQSEAKASTTPPVRYDRPPPPSEPAEPTQGNTLFRAGLALTISGAALGITAGALWYGRDVALSNAASARYWVEQDEHYDNARDLHYGAIATSAIAGAFIIAGVPMLIVGGTQRSRSRRVSATPQLGPRHAGATLTLRF